MILWRSIPFAVMALLPLLAGWPAARALRTAGPRGAGAAVGASCAAALGAGMLSWASTPLPFPAGALLSSVIGSWTAGFALAIVAFARSARTDARSAKDASRAAGAALISILGAALWLIYVMSSAAK